MGNKSHTYKIKSAKLEEKSEEDSDMERSKMQLAFELPIRAYFYGEEFVNELIMLHNHMVDARRTKKEQSKPMDFF